MPRLSGMSERSNKHLLGQKQLYVCKPATTHTMLSARGSLAVIILTQSSPQAETPPSSALSALRANQNARCIEGRDAQI